MVSLGRDSQGVAPGEVTLGNLRTLYVLKKTKPNFMVLRALERAKWAIKLIPCLVSC